MSDSEQQAPAKKCDAGGSSTSTASTKAQKATTVLNTRRTVCEQQMERSRDFVERMKHDPALISTSELTIRLEALENSFSTFLIVQSKIEERDPEETSHHHRSTYEELYYLTASNIKVMLRKLDHGANTTIMDNVVAERARPVRHDQLMADMPELRVQQSRPFNIVGIDYCGPFFVHFRRRATAPTKAYVAIFVCFVTKATHLELVDDLSTKGFLNALKRFIARRGRCAVLYSDNATNFVGARKELEELSSMFQQKQSHDEIAKECVINGIIWKHIPPRSPHFGGLWEAAVKPFKYHLKRIMNNSSLTFSEFNTLIIQIESILNSRPITAVPENACDAPALTPGHFIIGTALNAIPEPDVKAAENFNRLQRYQQLQWYFQQFWDKWHKDYLQSLHGRNKWLKKGPPLNIGDIVIFEEENIRRFSGSLHA
ncbi:uncharacterized protein LOC118738357 [Rhagoletis pomonella]|uniref:uncharacterized protein LOC118738357 n=1 Tax=Rhagoletis pomonella TaxID=28610 RepID=UPI001783EE25|nr:uncharacterized protein LOC118738357 [Rhagoletis pomonella]